MTYQKVLSVSFLAALAMSPASAHHAASAAFVVTETVEIEGYVDEFVFRNPHVNIILTVIDDGDETSWMVTAPATGAMRRWGWMGEHLRPVNILLSATPWLAMRTVR
jgi:hypothetical protein